MKLLTLGGTALLTIFAMGNANAEPLIESLFEESSIEYEEAPFEIGGPGPAGGVIFYLTEDKLHGMESAGYLKDSQGMYTLAEWGCNDIYKDVGFGVKIGEGKANSAELLEECVSERGGLIAAKHADNYVQNQYSDWYLPSQDELSEYSYLMWESGRKVVNSPADIEHYCTWSSTAVSPGRDDSLQKAQGNLPIRSAR